MANQFNLPGEDYQSVPRTMPKEIGEEEYIKCRFVEKLNDNYCRAIKLLIKVHRNEHSEEFSSECPYCPLSKARLI